MYSTNTATVASEFTSNYMPVGINENITLKEVNVNKTQNGRDFLEIVFENANGQTATMTEWKNEKNQWVVTDDDLQKKDNLQFGRILQVIDAIKGGHNDFEGTSFLEMINWTKQQLSEENRETAIKVLNTKLRLKVTYDKNGYTQVSKNGIFVESMGVEQSQIKLWKNDLTERPVKADVEKPVDPLTIDDVPFENSTPVTETGGMVHTTSTGADDLPF